MKAVSTYWESLKIVAFAIFQFAIRISIGQIPAQHFNILIYYFMNIKFPDHQQPAVSSHSSSVFFT